MRHRMETLWKYCYEVKGKDDSRALRIQDLDDRKTDLSILPKLLCGIFKANRLEFWIFEGFTVVLQLLL